MVHSAVYDYWSFCSGKLHAKPTTSRLYRVIQLIYCCASLVGGDNLQGGLYIIFFLVEMLLVSVHVWLLLQSYGECCTYIMSFRIIFIMKITSLRDLYRLYFGMRTNMFFTKEQGKAHCSYGYDFILRYVSKKYILIRRNEKVALRHQSAV